MKMKTSRARFEQRKQIIAEAAEQRYAEFTGGDTKYTSGTVDKVDERFPLMLRHWPRARGDGGFTAH